MLVKNCSEPDYDTWNQHRGQHLGTFEEFEQYEAALNKYEGTIATTDSEGIHEGVQVITAEQNFQAKEDRQANKCQARKTLDKVVQGC